MRTSAVLLVVASVALAGCGGEPSESAGGTAAPEASVPASGTAAPSSIPSTTTTTSTSSMPTTSSAPTTVAPATTTTSTTTSTTTTAASTTTTTTIATTTTTTTTPLTDDGSLDLGAAPLVLGTSVEGRPIVAERYGTIGGRRVLVIGVIHGNEDDGVAIVDQLRARAVPENVELWLVESMNPDGQAAQIRQNANGVDLNRNFPHDWGPIGQLGDSQFAGTGPASEPETQAMVAFIEQLRPDITIWYHQDANLVIPSTGRDGRIRARYAELTGLPIADCCGGGGIYTGIAATWARNELKQTSDAVPFIVELPGSLTAEQVTTHTDAVLTVAAEG
ncbi:M14 family zinc carboxypeptidase [Ilumatobacter sp.]|uniref:M14 family zinc carboxypeptidase n=1 Tax=Ilumatobacter sp. TaxID=1967498 RepID=UPI003AF5D059